jgi:hypothetical protein
VSTTRGEPHTGLVRRRWPLFSGRTKRPERRTSEVINFARYTGAVHIFDPAVFALAAAVPLPAASSAYTAQPPSHLQPRCRCSPVPRDQHAASQNRALPQCSQSGPHRRRWVEQNANATRHELFGQPTLRPSSRLIRLCHRHAAENGAREPSSPPRTRRRLSTQFQQRRTHAHTDPAIGPGTPATMSVIGRDPSSTAGQRLTRSFQRAPRPLGDSVLRKNGISWSAPIFNLLGLGCPSPISGRVLDSRSRGRSSWPCDQGGEFSRS